MNPLNFLLVVSLQSFYLFLFVDDRIVGWGFYPNIIVLVGLKAQPTLLRSTIQPHEIRLLIIGVREKRGFPSHGCSLTSFDSIAARNPPLGLLAVQKFLHYVLICFANLTSSNFFTGRRSLISFGQPSQNLLLLNNAKRQRITFLTTLHRMHRALP